MKPIYQVKQDFINALRNGNIHSIKHQYKQDIYGWSFDGVKDLIRTIPSFEQYIVGKLKPKSISELGQCSRKFCRPKNFITEALWVIDELRLCKNDLIKFVKIKPVIENLVLSGNYEAAREGLHDFNQQCGYSVWSLEIELLTYCLEKKYNEAIEFLSRINEENEKVNSGFVKYLLYWLYKRSLPNISPLKYDFDLLSYEKRNKTTFDDDKFKYFLFRLDYFEHPYTKDMSCFPIMESPHSIYDRYVTLCHMINSYISFGNNEEKLCAIEIGETLFRLFGDEKLISYSIIKNKTAPVKYFNDLFINILDAYYCGDYNQSYSLCKNFLQSNYPTIDIIKIYCRSLLFLGKDYENVGNDKSLINQVSKCLYKILDGDIGYIESLSRIHKNLYSFDIAYGLNHFLREERAGKVSHLELKLINTTFYDPYFENIYSDEKEKIEYLDMGLTHFPNSPSISYQKGRLLKNVSNFNVVRYIKDVDTAKIYYENDDFPSCIDIMNELMTLYPNCAPIIQTATQYIFDSLLKLDRNKDAYLFYISSYLASPIKVSKTNTKPLVDLFSKNKFKGERLTIELVLFIILNSEKATDKSYILEKFLAYNDCSLPSEYLSSDLIHWDNLIEVLFLHILNDELLRHLLVISSTQELLKERKRIVDILCEKCVLLNDEFRKIRQEIEQELDAYSASINDDESKIYANVPAIIKYEGDNLRILFDQLKTLYNVTDKSNRIWVVKGEAKDCNSIVPLSSLEQPVDMTDNVLAEISLQIFDAVRYLFLKSRFGIGTYLSTRIRHGVFEGELRSVFEKRHLALYMENNKYVYDPYWKREYSLSQPMYEELMNGLINISMCIDSQINYLKKEVIQIKIKPEESGLIDFSNIPEDEIFQSVISSYTDSLTSKNQFEEFIRNLINYLWGVMERCLKRIRDLFEKEAFSIISERLLSLNNLHVLSEKSNFSREFKEAINNASIELNHKQIRIKHWFHIQDVRIENYKLRDLINLSMDTCKRYHPGKIVHLETDEVDISLFGWSRIHLSDVFRTIFTNMILYCKHDFLPKLLLRIKEKDGKLILEFINDIDCDEKELNLKLSSVMNSSEALQKEGRSGLVKIRKIIKFDLGCEDNEIEAFAKEGKFTTKVSIDLKKLRC